MTKKEIHNAINIAFYQFVNEKYPQYSVEGDCEGGRKELIYIGEWKDGNRDMQYQVSQHYISGWNDKLTGKIEDEMNLFLEDQKRKYNIV